MKRWSYIESERIESPAVIEAFLDEIEKISKEYGLSISHEDSHGGFIIETYDHYNISWLRECSININDKKLGEINNDYFIRTE